MAGKHGVQGNRGRIRRLKEERDLHQKHTLRSAKLASVCVQRNEQLLTGPRMTVLFP